MQDQLTPYGYCECGCGQRTKLAIQTHTKEGTVKGEPRRFLKGHNKRDRGNYRVEDRGYETPCWIWQGRVNDNGYGPHRRYYERLIGPAGDLHLDHRCRNRACVNPEHLEPVTVDENNRRSFFGRKINGQFRREQEAAA